MDNLNNVMIYVSADGDSIGSKVGRAALSDDISGLNSLSEHIEAGNQAIKAFALKNGGQVISSGGDEATIKLPLKNAEELGVLRADYSFITGATLTVGVGESLSQSSKALMVGKLRGKNQICQYDDSVEQEYQQATQEANSGSSQDQEKKKIGEAYMKDNKNPADPFPVHPDNKSQDNSGKQQAEETAGNTTQEDESGQESGQNVQEHDDCPYCQEESGQGELEGDDCPYCEKEEQVESAQGDTDDCPYCAEAHSESDHQHDENCPHCQELDAANAQKDDQRAESMDQSVNPEASAASSTEEDETGNTNDFDGTSGQRQEAAAAPIQEENEEPFAEEHKSPEDVLQEFDNKHGDPSQEDDSKFEQIDDIGLAEPDKGQEQNISRPEDFNGEIKEGSDDPANTAGQEEQSEDPNYSEVMQQDMDNSQDDIQKERVGNMVRQALTSFKNSKDYLEQAKDQAPAFYQSNILMLRGMIEMAKLLGFSGPAQQQESTPELGQEESQLMPERADAGTPNPADPFPQHPENGGQEQEDSSGQAPERKQSDWSNPFPTHEENSGFGGMDAGKPKAPPEE